MKIDRDYKEILEDFKKDNEKNLKLYKITNYAYESYMNANAFINLPNELQERMKEQNKIVKQIINNLNYLIYITEQQIKDTENILFDD